LFKMHSVKHTHNSIALFLFLLILYESLMHALWLWTYEEVRRAVSISTFDYRLRSIHIKQE
jgi:hypothetical protein